MLPVIRSARGTAEFEKMEPMKYLTEQGEELSKANVLFSPSLFVSSQLFKLVREGEYTISLGNVRRQVFFFAVPELSPVEQTVCSLQVK